MSITITAAVNGALIPPTDKYPAAVTNGDFLITSNTAHVPMVGDGVNETTTWAFDFTSDPCFRFFSSSNPLTSALLTLTLTPKNGLITTDTVRVDGLDSIVTPTIQGLPVGVTSTIQVQLLDEYTSREILDAIASGQIPMTYLDDAIVSSAKLELTQQCPTLQYAVKFICGKSEGRVVAPGVYWTAVNVHNPTYKDVGFRKKIAIALPNGKTGPVSKFVDVNLGPDEALEIDCEDIRQHIDFGDELLKGFVVIESDVELDVVVVYTAAGATQQIETLHTERVSPRTTSLSVTD